MEHIPLKGSVMFVVFLILFVSFSTNFVNAESVPEWIKNTALWYGEGIISETEFLNMIKFLVENDVIMLENNIVPSENLNAEIIIPNGNFDISSSSFYIPLNLEVSAGTTVTWANEDTVPHTIQSQDEFGKVMALFNSAPLNTGDRFEFTFEKPGVYNYFCSFHPWRVGLVTIK